MLGEFNFSFLAYSLILLIWLILSKINRDFIKEALEGTLEFGDKKLISWLFINNFY